MTRRILVDVHRPIMILPTAGEVPAPPIAIREPQ